MSGEMPQVVLNFPTGTVVLRGEDNRVEITGILFPREFKAANEILALYIEQARQSAKMKKEESR